MSGGKKDLYAVLGVPRDVSPVKLREAFQSLALRHHPDREGGETGAFQEIAAAYKVLSEPDSRARYDEQSPPSRTVAPVRRASAEPVVPVEPLRGRRRAAVPRPVLFVDPSVALHGGAVTVVLPVAARCPRCQGLAGDPFCACAGAGRIRTALPLQLCLPPLVHDGGVYPVEIEGVGVIELEIRVR